MLRPLFWLFRWILSLVLSGYTVSLLWVSLAPSATLSATGWETVAFNVFVWAFVAGFFIRWLLARMGSGDPLELLDTLEHELTHAVAGWLTFAPPVSLKATLRDGGEVELKRANPIAVLAPYCLPLYAALLAPLTLVLLPGWMDYARLGVAGLLGSFAWRLLREFHFDQTDFQEFGTLYSIVTVLAVLPLCVLGILDIAGLMDVPWAGALTVLIDQVITMQESMRS